MRTQFNLKVVSLNGVFLRRIFLTERRVELINSQVEMSSVKYGFLEHSASF